MTELAQPLVQVPALRRGIWYWLTPALAGMAVAAVVLLLLVFISREEREEQRVTMITDALWLEQNLRFHLQNVTGQIERLAAEAAGGELTPTAFTARGPVMMRIDPELVELRWIDASGRMVVSVPPDQLPSGKFAPGAQDAWDRMRRLGRPDYVRTAKAPIGYEVWVPAFAGDRFAGAMVGRISLPDLLRQQVPWWLAQKYRVTVIDGDGRVLAAKSNVDTQHLGGSHALAFDPPGFDWQIRLEAYETPSNWLRNGLGAFAAGLLVLLLFSLWRLRAHVAHRLAAEAALREEHAFRQAMEESLTIGLRARDLDGRIIYVNQAFCRMVGYRADELVGRAPPMPYWDPDDLARHERQAADVMAGTAPRQGFESQLRHKDGRIVHTMVYAAPLIDAGGRQSGWMSSIVDITEQKRVEELNRAQQERLQATSHLVTMGEMASSLAHELNQPLSAIASYANGCVNLLKDGEVTREELLSVLEKVARQAARAGTIIRGIYDFVRRRDPTLVSSDMNIIVEAALELMAADIRRQRVQLVTALAPALPSAMVDPVMIEQVVINLVRNAVEAVLALPEDTRQVVVTTACVDDGVCVRVADNGQGVPPEAVPELFSAFYTTKNKGMGMGLNICRSIIEFHHGRLWFSAGETQGAVFQFVLPLEEKAGESSL